MQGMLAQFQGFVVDWGRGEVVPRSGARQRLTLSPAFFRDLDWWSRHLRARGFTPFAIHSQRAEAVLTGTDASGWGTGQVAWLDGGREESILRFTAAEKRRPINWRELLGVVRICEVWGPRLRGKTVLIETDNMAAAGAASKLSSKAADMQELVRRLLRLSEVHGFYVRITHTPGEKLDRPDQTSRGDAIEEPRARLRRELFEDVCGRWGAPASYIGTERDYGAVGSGATPTKLYWAHPTMATVGSALRRIQENLGEDLGGSRALAFVPDLSLIHI